MKYTIHIEHNPTLSYPFFACTEDRKIACSGATAEEAEKELIELIKKSREAQPTITKEIDI